MVMYSFKPRFVAPIRCGLNLAAVPGVEPKTHTIRADRKPPSRHARPGDPITLWCRPRRPDGFKIGESTCESADPIRLDFRRERIEFARSTTLSGARALDVFARSDGFGDWADMREFWRVEHGGVSIFEGAIINWKPGGAGR